MGAPKHDYGAPSAYPFRSSVRPRAAQPDPGAIVACSGLRIECEDDEQKLAIALVHWQSIETLSLRSLSRAHATFAWRTSQVSGEVDCEQLPGSFTTIELSPSALPGADAAGRG